jgi:hypothetical protein
MSLSLQQHFLAARTLLGLYGCVHFIMLLPYATELFSRDGMLPDGQLSPLLHAFPNVLALYDAPWVAQSVVALGALSSAMLTLGRYPRGSALVTYYAWACLFGRNPLIDNPSLPYVGLMLLVCAGVGARLAEDAAAAQRPARVLWIAMALGYTYSGMTKLVSPSWLNGNALSYVLENPLARPGPARALLGMLSTDVMRVFTYAALALELAFAPLSLIARLRPWLWSALLGMHLSLLATVQFAELSIGMILLHVFTFDPRWIETSARDTQNSIVSPSATGISPVGFSSNSGRISTSTQEATCPPAPTKQRGRSFLRGIGSMRIARKTNGVVM